MIIRFFATLRTVTGSNETRIPAPESLEILLEKLSKQYGRAFDREIWLYRDGEKKDLIPGVIILVNGRHYLHLDRLSTRLEENDVVSLFPPVAGG